MATIDEQLAAQTQLLQQLLQTVQNLAPAKADDLTPVTTALAGQGAALSNLQVTVNAIAAKLPTDAQAAG